jgi:hypothetical protein
MWLNVKWFDAAGNVVREDGEYGPLAVTVNGTPYTVETILDINDPNTKVYEANMGVSQAWAAKLLTMGYSPNLPLKYNRVTGAPAGTLQSAASGAQRRDVGRQPHPALQDESRRSVRAQRAAHPGHAVRKPERGRFLQPLG